MNPALLHICHTTLHHQAMVEGSFACACHCAAICAMWLAAISSTGSLFLWGMRSVVVRILPPVIAVRVIAGLTRTGALI